ncbi:MAG: hypothetical protein C0624_06615 [Desulfuromonas sp.]|nr:MAG: hypothetical protein C0624_06615 [Desulfuromonas sp.]
MVSGGRMTERVDIYRQELDEINRLCEEGQSGEAWEHCKSIEKQAEEAGASEFALFFRGEADALMGDVRRGAKLQERAVHEIGPIPFMLGNCAVLLSMAGKPKNAVVMLDQVLERERDNLQALGQKGVSLAKMGYDEQALECFDRILELDPGQHHALRNRAVSLSRLGQEKDALRIFEEVLAENPADAHARSERTILLDEIELRGTPLGWLLLWIRKRLAPMLLRVRYRWEPETS